LKPDESINEFNEEQQDVLKSIRVERIILPVLIGIGVVIYLVLKQFNIEEFWKIMADASGSTVFWILISVVILVIRHFAYATRLRVLSEGEFSWRKCIELIFIWEFSAAVSPTSVGGSAVAFFVLAQEKLSAAKTGTIVLYTIVLDTIFFVASLPILLAIFGTEMIRPAGEGGVSFLDGWGYYFIFAYLLMATYGTLFYWGLFHSPRQIKRLLAGVTRIGFLKKYRQKALDLGDDVIVASAELKRKEPIFHLKAFLATVTAWSCRFLLLNALIIAFTSVPVEFWEQFKLYSRLESMFVIIAFSPTPGGAGFVEILFNGFLTDYMESTTYSTMISTIWRILTYYSYLLVGVIVIPNWIRNVLNERAKSRKKNI
jgi:uncharacterized membrane protein YbhN (UPF0104 family)